MSGYLELPIGAKSPEIVTTVIEIPGDSTNKYEYDPNLEVFALDRVLHSPVHYPGDYGFVAQTLAEDGDPLDILILGGSPTFTGCIYNTRPVGLFEMFDQGAHDEKILAYGTGNPRFSQIREYTEIEPHILREVEHFFSVYKALEGKETNVVGWKTAEVAHGVIQQSHERFLATPGRRV